MLKICTSLAKWIKRACHHQIPVWECEPQEAHVFFTLGMPIKAATKRHFQEIRGNRTFHSIRSTETSFHLKVNKLMCYCKFCLSEEYNADSNKNCVSNWEERAIEKKPTRVVVAEASAVASTVAIESGDTAGECYLLKVTSGGCDGLFLSSQRSCPGCIHLKWRKRGNSLCCHYHAFAVLTLP